MKKNKVNNKKKKVVTVFPDPLTHPHDYTLVHATAS